MSKFLKLTSIAINTRYITKVSFCKVKSTYSIHMKDCITGDVSGNGLFFYGEISNNKVINVLECDKDDYEVVKNWFNNLSNKNDKTSASY